jgi:hypothetical protein
MADKDFDEISSSESSPRELCAECIGLDKVGDCMRSDEIAPSVDRYARFFVLTVVKQPLTVPNCMPEGVMCGRFGVLYSDIKADIKIVSNLHRDFSFT